MSIPHSCCQDCDASIRLDPVWVEPRLRRAAALRSLGRVGEAGQEYEKVVAMEEGCQEAQEGLAYCRQETGDRNISELENKYFWFRHHKRGRWSFEKNQEREQEKAKCLHCCPGKNIISHISTLFIFS